MEVGTFYQLERIADDATASEQPHVWEDISQKSQSVVTRIYRGTVTLASRVNITDVQWAELDLRALLESGEIPVIGVYPRFEGLTIMHNLQAKSYIAKLQHLNPSDETLRDIDIPYKTVFVIKYASGMRPLDEEERQTRLSYLRNRKDE